MNILNTFPRQRLHLPAEAVVSGRLVWLTNCQGRPDSLGEARNWAIEHSVGDIIVIWDDDDIPLLNHLSTIAAAFAANSLAQWVWLDSQLYMEGTQIKGIVQGSCPLFAFTRKAWQEVGGYPPMTVGEDRKLIAAIMQKSPGVRISPPSPTFIYRWGQGTYHASGLGEDRAGQSTAHERVAADLQERVRKGLEPTGDITLAPGFKLDYEGLAAEFVANQNRTQPKVGSRVIIEGGRLGDIINVLPIARYFHLQGETPWFMVAWNFRQILEGASYIRPYPVRIEHSQLNDMLQVARANFAHVTQCQIWGVNYTQTRVCRSFNEESWRMAGFLNRFHDQSFPLVFDRRDADRERVLCEKAFRTDKPKIVTNLTSAVSAPFPPGQKILERMHLEFPDYEVVEVGGFREKTDLGNLHCLYPFDVLGIMGHPAVKLILTIDTATLHLALACPAPMVCIVRAGWEGAIPRWGCPTRLLYPDVEREPGIVIESVRKVLGV
jgi:hypothetical protein